MRNFLKALFRPLLRVPVLGRLLRVLLAAWRAPVGAVRLDQVERAALELTVRLDALQAQTAADRQSSVVHMDRLLSVVTDVSARQAEADADRDNLARSVPVALRRLARHDVDLRVQLEEAQARLASLEHRAAEPVVLPEEVTTLGARVDEAAGHVGYLLERVEFVRSELMFEIRYGASSGGGDVAPAPVVKAPLEGRAGPMRVNLGCGHVPLDGYVNVDNRDLPGVDVVADVRHLPFEDGTVDEFFSSHFLEHFPQEQLRRVVLPYLRDKLAPGGRMRAVVPDIDAMMREYVAGRYPYGDLREVVYGGQDYDGDFHFNMFTPESLSALLAELGFVDIDVPTRGRVNGRSLEFEIGATRA
ncbi:class I SAM-dependent methyltransferase [Cellulomonas wangsupingiae]|uniref:class I SAM-dependent methyltransferase n=1 Tax=Cellulomonas wangsupingiae TaxID=2968085 RepID=UPI001D0E86C0|nr:methyltransferase domain-containing protein [Cellulomonas wangsupingiae]MCM0640331.1 methyltransferase domain-containing protein [Cellulomonas wangsupingiae]